MNEREAYSHERIGAEPESRPLLVVSLRHEADMQETGDSLAPKLLQKEDLSVSD